jgi:hypothetical protein
MGENMQSINTGFQRAKDVVAAVGPGEGGWLDLAYTARDFVGAKGLHSCATTSKARHCA